MKKICLLVALIFSLSACSLGGSESLDSSQPPQEDNRIEWSSQADEIRPLFSAVLSDFPSDGVEARVSNSSGDIKIRINSFNTHLTFQDFAEVVRICYDKYSALILEYSDYSFGSISFYYIAEDASAILTYVVDNSGVGSFTEDRKISEEPFTLTLTPDEVYLRLQDTLDYIS